MGLPGVGWGEWLGKQVRIKTRNIRVSENCSYIVPAVYLRGGLTA